MSIDSIVSSIGEFGLQQKRYSFCTILLNVYGAFYMLQYTFVGYSVPFQCYEIPLNLTVHRDKCPDNSVQNCGKITFNTNPGESTIVTEWNLICDQSWLGPLMMSAFMAGVMAGAPILGSVADSIGRKKALMLTLILVLVSNGICSLVNSYYLYLSLKFLNGFFQSGFIISTFVLGNELVGPSKRAFIGVAMSAGFAVGIAIFAFLAYHVQNWRMLTGIISLLGSPMLLMHFYLPESPHWLNAQGRKDEALQVLKHIAEKNSAKWESTFTLEDDKTDKTKTSPTHTNSSTSDKLIDLFQEKSLCILTVIQIYSWFVNSSSYYGLTLSAGKSAGDKYTATALSGIVELPSYVLSLFLLSYLGRKWTLAGFMISAGVALLAIPIMSSHPGIITTLSMFSKLCISASFAIAYIHSGEIFPTSIRNGALGIVSLAARVGGIATPYMVALGNVAPNLHFILFGCLSLSAGIFNLKLPETQGRSLPDTIRSMMIENNNPVKPRNTSSNAKYSLLPQQEEESQTAHVHSSKISVV